MENTKDFNTINETFPRIGNALKIFWGSREFVNYTENLFFDTRDGERQGFPPNVLAAIHRLCQLHDKHFPEFVKVEPKSPPFTF